MKAPARLALVLLAGLPLTGCVSKTAMTEPKPSSSVVTWNEKPQSGRDHWLMRSIDDKIEATLASNGSR